MNLFLRLTCSLFHLNLEKDLKNKVNGSLFLSKQCKGDFWRSFFGLLISPLWKLGISVLPPLACFNVQIYIHYSHFEKLYNNQVIKKAWKVTYNRLLVLIILHLQFRSKSQLFLDSFCSILQTTVSRKIT